MQDLRAWRLQNGWTQEQLAEKLGAAESTVKRWERGETVPDRYNRDQLANLGFGQIALVQKEAIAPSPEGVSTMSPKDNDRIEHPSTYFAQDRSDTNELTRLQIQEDFLNSKIPLLPQSQQEFQRILDVGCGTGGWLIEVAKTYPSISLLVGVDVSGKMVEYARTQAAAAGVSDRVEFHVMDALRMLEFSDRFFDLVNMRLGGSFLRTWDWSKLLQECIRISRPGGILQVCEAEIEIESSSPGYTRWWTSVIAAFRQAGHTPDQTFEQTLLGLFNMFGLKNVQSTVHKFIYQGGEPDGETWAADVRLAMKTTAPFLQRWLPAAEHRELCQQVDSELQSQFTIVNFMVTVTGQV